jgi:hypothetical protein
VPKYHKVVVITNPISPEELIARINASEEASVTAVFVDSDGRRARHTLKTDRAMSWQAVVALALRFVDNVEEDLESVGPINQDRIPADEGSESAT